MCLDGNLEFKNEVDRDSIVHEIVFFTGKHRFVGDSDFLRLIYQVAKSQRAGHYFTIRGSVLGSKADEIAVFENADYWDKSSDLVRETWSPIS